MLKLNAFNETHEDNKKKAWHSLQLKDC